VGHILGFFLSVTIALTIGFGATWLFVHNGHGFVRIDAGAWSTWVKAGSIEADPYTKAIIAKSAEIPLQAAEGLTMIALADDDGRAFDTACTYIVSGTVPSARLWTLTAYGLDGQFLANDALRYSFSSDEIVRNGFDNSGSGRFEITVSAYVQAGNWLPLHKSKPFKLILRLYDASVGRTKPEIQAAILLNTARKSCT
jgi:hypothetical protein